ncbi:uncharacterized protein LOC119792346 [Cyprinodon tularosa]|uniref:uncharacterized protein LOC119792346 n=1 Tax=Cyprinodon tularosa TaxID=77115 RepID=UPI0018E1F459|nr:uncharacterized protein LOC119792346 [Cyprinodon tularosa]
MDAVRISLLLLLPFFACSEDSEVTLVKTVGNEPDLTPLCNNETSNNIMLIVCRIRTERNKGEECSLLYREGGEFVHQCDSRFTLRTWNDTVFLHLTNLTAADSGNYTCECSNIDGTYIHHLNITVKDNGEDDIWEVWSHYSRVILLSALTAAVIFILLVILGFFHRRCYNREEPESPTYSPNEDLVLVEPYSTFIQKENVLYSTALLQNYEISSEYHNTLT